MTKSRSVSMRGFRAGAATAAMATMLAAAPAMAIVPNENTDSEAIVDNDDEFAGVGQFFSNSGVDGDTGLGLCTGSLINPRAVLFAAHCVNDLPATAYNDGTRISSFGFNVNNLPAVQEWLAPFIDPDGGFVFNTAGLTADEIAALRPNPLLRQTSVANNLFNISQIQYDPRSLQNPQALGFIEADIAVATLDTPAGNLPTWALLFSILPAPDGIDPVTGTGYNVDIVGFGGTGTALDGPIFGIDFRRRAAENVLGGFLSLDDRNNVIFGPDDPFLPQNLYNLDFDSTTPDDFFFDFNVHQDDPLPNEGTTAGGDSGGPLILRSEDNDITDEELVIGVLSGGSRFFGATPFSSLGTTSFYQPLALFWQYIAEVNPYRYVGTNGGDGNWEDADHWVTLLDPNYRIIDENGNVVNGLPTTPELGLNGTEGDFGGVCVEGIGAPGIGPDECQDVATGIITTPDGDPIDPPADPTEAGSEIFNNRGEADIAQSGNDVIANAEGVEGTVTAETTTTAPVEEAASAEAAAATSEPALGEGLTGVQFAENAPMTTRVEFAEESPNTITVTGSEEAPMADAVEGAEESPMEEGMDPDPDPAPEPLPDPTLANGLPGATGFVPDNVDPGFTEEGDVINGRYFDVTLANAGTTTLSSAVNIDRLTVSGTAGLDVTADGELFTWLGVMQTGGTVNVDGVLSMNSDYSLMAGMLSGSGTIVTPFLTNLTGAIAPGGMDNIGTLTIEGNVILTSGSTLIVDIDNAGNSDTLAVTRGTITETDDIGNPVLDDDGNPNIIPNPDAGNLDLGGIVAFNQLTEFLFNDGDTFTIATAEGDVTNSFNTGFGSAVLGVAFENVTDETTGVTSVNAVFDVNTYASVVDPNSAVQSSFAQLLDQNRANGLTNFADIYRFTEFADAATLGATLEGLAPVTETTNLSVAEMMLNSMTNFYRNRTATAFDSDRGGTVATSGTAVQLASASAMGLPTQGAFAATTSAAQNDTVNDDSGLSSDFALFLSGGFLVGEGVGMPAALTTQDDQYDGFFIAAGLEYLPNENVIIGFSGSYSDVEGNSQAGARADGQLWQGTIYGALRNDSGLTFDGLLSLGSYSTETLRTVTIGTNSFNLSSDDDSLAFAADFGISKDFETKTVLIRPRVGLSYQMIDFGDVQETGGLPALAIQRDRFDTLQGRAGVTATTLRGKAFRPWIRADYVHDFLDRDGSFGANFVGGSGALAPFAIASDDSDWVEAGVGLNYDVGNVTIGVSAETTVGRSDFQNQSYQGSIRFRF
ncbi:MAG: autotransporter domain-containing protein [Pseudomonadota bacterium]